MLFGFVAIIVTLLVMSPKLSGSEVFQTFTAADSGSDMLELIASQALIIYCLIGKFINSSDALCTQLIVNTGSDSTAHLAEETQLAATVIPKAMIVSYCITGLMNFITLITLCFCFVDPEQASSSTTYPFLTVFTSATGSAQGATGLGSILILLIGCSTVNYMVSEVEAHTHSALLLYAHRGSDSFRAGILFPPSLCLCKRQRLPL